MPYFVVVNEQGPAWVTGRSMREQPGWTEHADYVNAAMRAGLVLLGGPIGDGSIHRAMLILFSEGEPTVRAWLDADPWIRSGTLRTRSLEPWNMIVSHDKLDPALAEITGLPSHG
jgi:uncharacterized protein YciI